MSSAQAAIAAVGLAMSVFGLFPTAQEIFLSFAGGFGRKAFSMAYLLICFGVAVAVVRSQPSTITIRYDMVRRMSLVLAAVQLIVVVYYYGAAAMTSMAMKPASDDFGSISGLATGPDVYHIVLDGFGRPDVLSLLYDVDISPMTSELKRRGFTIDDEVGLANYTQTYLSLASMLNARYLDSLAAERGDSVSRVPLNDIIQHSSVFEALKRLHYEIVFLGSIYSATQGHRLADRCDCGYAWIGEFESLVLQSTPFGDLGVAGIDYYPHRKKIRHTFDALASLAPSTRPRYVFAHIMAPHPPFVFDAQGRDVVPPRAFSLNDGSMYGGTIEEYQHGYREQVQYIAARLLEVLTHFDELSKSNQREAVVIIHGDHGPRARFHALEATQTDPFESVPVLLAIRWAPTGRADARVTSLVNIYRSFFRRYYTSALPLLPDRAFVSSFRKPYEFLETHASPGGGRSYLIP